MQLFPDNRLSQNLKLRRWFIVALVLLALLLTGPGVGAYYIGESLNRITPQDWGVSMLGAIIKPQIDGFYRPMLQALLVGQYRLFGTNPLIPRAIRFAMYAATCVLAFLILEALSQSFLTGAVGAVLFTIMPSHVGPVFQMAAQTLYSVFFSMLAIWLAGPSFRKKASWLKSLFASVAYIAGLLTYPDTILVIPILIAYELLWGIGGEDGALKRRLIRAHLPLWIISATYLGLRFYQFMTVGAAAGTYLTAAKGLTAAMAAKKVIPIIYEIIRPLQLSPALCFAAILLLCLTCKANWRFVLFLLLWVAITPALNYAQPYVQPGRVYFASFGMAGLLGHLSLSLGGILEPKRRRPLAGLLEWLTVIAIGYWVFELLNMGWAELFFGENLKYHFRFYAAAVAVVAIGAICAITKSLVPRLSMVPLRFLSAAVFALIIAFYIAGFLKMFGMFLTESENVKRIPKAVIAAQPTIPDNVLMLIVLPDSMSIDDPFSPAMQINIPVRAEYGKSVQALAFEDWMRSFQHQAIGPDKTVVALRFDGQRAVPDPILADRVLKRQRSYDRLSSDVIHARAVAESPGASELRLKPEIDSMLIDKLDLELERASSQATVQLEFTENGRPTTLQLSARMQGAVATVRLNQQRPWLLAQNLGQVNIKVLADGASLPIRRATFVQTAGLIHAKSTAIATLPRPSPPSSTQLRLILGMHEIDRCVTLP
ncbi:MAG TPA: hypothetical protein VM163_05135 [bacterium]|nr:hypothetical protein [bacterium]